MRYTTIYHNKPSMFDKIGPWRVCFSIELGNLYALCFVLTSSVHWIVPSCSPCSPTSAIFITQPMRLSVLKTTSSYMLLSLFITVSLRVQFLWPQEPSWCRSVPLSDPRIERRKFGCHSGGIWNHSAFDHQRHEPWLHMLTCLTWLGSSASYLLDVVVKAGEPPAAMSHCCHKVKVVINGDSRSIHD